MFPEEEDQEAPKNGVPLGTYRRVGIKRLIMGNEGGLLSHPL